MEDEENKCTDQRELWRAEIHLAMPGKEVGQKDSCR
jgi:hypothetical protein